MARFRLMAFHVIICIHIVAPLYIIDLNKLNPRDFNLYAYNLESLLDKILPARRLEKPRRLRRS